VDLDLDALQELPADEELAVGCMATCGHSCSGTCPGTCPVTSN
jgi:hypothetical protein